MIQGLQGKTVTEDQAVTFTCELSKSDQPVQWYKDGKPIRHGVKFKPSSQGTLYSLTIARPTVEDSAEYTVKIGDLSSKAKLVVHGENFETCSLCKTVLLAFKSEKTVLLAFKSEKSIYYHGCFGHHWVSIVETPITFTVPLQSVTVTEEEKAEFLCQLSKPVKNVKWFRDGSALKHGKKYDVKCEGAQHSLKIHKALTEDAGEYAVQANGAKSEAQLTVEGEAYCLGCSASIVVCATWHGTQCSTGWHILMRSAIWLTLVLATSARCEVFLRIYSKSKSQCF